MKKFLKNILLISMMMNLGIVYAQDLNQKYSITIWNKDVNGNEKENHLETMGFLPIFNNTRDEVTVGNKKFIFESNLNIQILEDNQETMKVELKYKDNNKEYDKKILIKDKEKKDLQDFKIEIIRD